MANYDIPVSADLQKALELPQCIDLSLPKPGPLKITLPTGGSLTAFTDLSKGVPTDCSLSFSLLLQVSPLLASMECLLKILGLLKPLVDVINGLPTPSPAVILDFGKAASALLPCFNILLPQAGMAFFVRDLLCLIIKVLNCFIGQLKTIAGVMGGLAIRIQAAQENNDADQLALLQCAQDNAAASAGAVMQAIEPIGALLSIMGTVMGIVGAPAITLPALGSPEDVEALNQAVTTLESVVDTLSQVVEALPPGGPC